MPKDDNERYCYTKEGRKQVTQIKKCFHMDYAHVDENRLHLLIDLINKRDDENNLELIFKSYRAKFPENIVFGKLRNFGIFYCWYKETYISPDKYDIFLYQTARYITKIEFLPLDFSRLGEPFFIKLHRLFKLKTMSSIKEFIRAYVFIVFDDPWIITLGRTIKPKNIFTGAGWMVFSRYIETDNGNIMLHRLIGDDKDKQDMILELNILKRNYLINKNVKMFDKIGMDMADLGITKAYNKYINSNGKQN